MIHGKTKIELYNPNTKIKNVVRSENTFQNTMVAKYMRSLGRAEKKLNISSDSDLGWSWQNVLGGIFLFRDTETVGNEYMSATNRMVGNGAYGVANADVPNELGTFNSQESSASTSAITQVYDFATNQANGQIGCVCLTSQTGGYIGYGNPSGTSTTTKRNYYAGTSVSRISSGEHAFRNNIRYKLEYAKPILTVTKTYVPVTVGSIKSGFSDSFTLDLSSLENPDNIMHICRDGDYIYFISEYSQIAVNGTLYYYKLDLVNETITRESFTNVSSRTLYPSTYGFSVANGVAYIGASDNAHTELFDISTGILLKEFDFSNGMGYPYVSGLTIVKDGNGYPSIYNRQNDTLLPTNGQFSTSYNAGFNYIYDNTCDVFYNLAYNNALNIGCVPQYLATINNLQNPVTKTAAQTMKVTYTLTEE